MPKRIDPAQCLGVIIDVQDYFLAQVDKSLRVKLKTNFKHFARLSGHFQVPILVTLERPVAHKGRLPKRSRSTWETPR
jgi:isochorismate hydrolase